MVAMAARFEVRLPLGLALKHLPSAFFALEPSPARVERFRTAEVLAFWLLFLFSFSLPVRNVGSRNIAGRGRRSQDLHELRRWRLGVCIAFAVAAFQPVPERLEGGQAHLFDPLLLSLSSRGVDSVDGRPRPCRDYTVSFEPSKVKREEPEVALDPPRLHLRILSGSLFESLHTAPQRCILLLAIITAAALQGRKIGSKLFVPCTGRS